MIIMTEIKRQTLRTDNSFYFLPSNIASMVERITESFFLARSRPVIEIFSEDCRAIPRG